MTRPVTLTRDGAIATITLSSPETRNAISVEQTDALVEICDELNEDISVRCAIIVAEGDIFSAGGNIKDMHQRRGHFAGGPAEVRRYYQQGNQRMARALYGLEVPLIVAVNGPAIGAGFDICMMADIRIASETAIFAESFINLGLVAATGGAWFLVRKLSPAVAAELTLTGERIDARRALELGVVSRVVARDELLATARGIADRIAVHAPHAIRLNKRLLRESATVDLTAGLEIAANLQAIAQHTEDQREAVAAVIEKRAPVFHGR
jgi:enoyl-CoA hydratase/carnithine racemase